MPTVIVTRIASPNRPGSRFSSITVVGQTAGPVLESRVAGFPPKGLALYEAAAACWSTRFSLTRRMRASPAASSPHSATAHAF
jgi:hypothetical protein